MRNILTFMMFVLTATPTYADHHELRHVLVLLVDNSSTTPLAERPLATRNIHRFLDELTKLRNKKATKDIQIMLFLSTLPNRVSWMGTPAELRQESIKVMEMIAFRETCSDLVLAYEELETAMSVNPPSRIDLFSFSPLVHFSFADCKENETIKLPQEVPEKLLLGKIAKKATSTNLWNVNEDQKKVYADYLFGQGMKAGDFDIQGIGTTNSRLSRWRLVK